MTLGDQRRPLGCESRREELTSECIALILGVHAWVEGNPRPVLTGKTEVFCCLILDPRCRVGPLGALINTQ